MPNDFVGLILLDRFSTIVPAPNIALAIKQENGIVAHMLQKCTGLFQSLDVNLAQSGFCSQHVRSFPGLLGRPGNPIAPGMLLPVGGE